MKEEEVMAGGGRSPLDNKDSSPEREEKES